MTIINTTQQVVEFKKQAERHKELLYISPKFTPIEHEKLFDLYDEIIEILNNNIAKDIEVLHKTQL